MTSCGLGHYYLLKGGKIPEKSSHSVIESPEFVSLVKPPIIIIEKISAKLSINQFLIKLLIFLSCVIIYFNIYSFLIIFTYLMSLQ